MSTTNTPDDHDAIQHMSTHLLSDVSNSLRFASEERNKEIKEKKKTLMFQRRLKFCAYFFISFSCFILINACVGFSSAPFYLPEVDCNRLEPSADCLQLKKITSAMYTVELIGSLLMVMHGLLLIAIVDYIKNLTLIVLLRRYTKVLFVAYGLIMVVRVGLYLRVHQDVLQHDKKGKD